MTTAAATLLGDNADQSEARPLHPARPKEGDHDDARYARRVGSSRVSPMLRAQKSELHRPLWTTDQIILFSQLRVYLLEIPWSSACADDQQRMCSSLKLSEADPFTQV